MALLYLDYDGVLHPDEVYRTPQGIVLRRDGMNLFEWAPLLAELLAPYPQVRIVLATTWVPVLGFDEARNWLPSELATRVIGATFHRQHTPQWRALPRWSQILRDVKRRGTQCWIALDDDGAGWPAEHRHHLVLTDSDLGLPEARVLDELAEKLRWLQSMPPCDVDDVQAGENNDE